MPELLRLELNTECIRTVHRLDAQVAGLMVYAQSAKAASKLGEQIREHMFRQEYLAVIHGDPSERGSLIVLLGKDKRRRALTSLLSPERMSERNNLRTA
ncbi:MAG: hypothetical protein II458_09200 [Oscillospiraceae bacterium]|nr:hypothetical protein [Oscillospiraceae bacterium]